MPPGTISVEVRRISEADIPGFRDCLDAVARERKFLAQIEGPPLEKVKAFVLSNIQSNVPQFVAIADSKVVGWCDVCPRPYDGMRHRGTLGMGVLHAWRGKGVGRRLLDSTIAQAREAGISRIELEVFSSNVGAIALYERAGFMREGVKRRGRILDGIADDVICMALVE